MDLPRDAWCIVAAQLVVTPECHMQWISPQHQLESGVSGGVPMCHVTPGRHHSSIGHETPLCCCLQIVGELWNCNKVGYFFSVDCASAVHSFRKIECLQSHCHKFTRDLRCLLKFENDICSTYFIDYIKECRFPSTKISTCL